MRLVLVGTYGDLPWFRSGPFREFLGDMRREGAVCELRLAGLDREDTARLLRWVSGREPGPELLGEVQRLTGGNPLFVEELGRALGTGAGEPGACGTPVAGGEHIIRSLRPLIELRLARLPERAQELLREGALIGESFGLEELELLRRQADSERCEELLAQATAAGLLHPGDRPGEYHFAHALIHEAVLAQLSAAQRDSLAARLVEGVEGRHAGALSPWARRLSAWCSMMRGEEADARRRGYLKMAAQAALDSGAWEECFDLCRLLVDPEQERADNPEEAEAFVLLGRGRFACGDRPAATALFREAFDYYRAQSPLEPMIQIATQPGYLSAGEPGFYDFFEPLLPLLPPESPVLGSVLLFYGIVLCQNVGEYRKAEELVQRALDIGRRCGDPILEARCLTALGYLDDRFFRHEQALDKCAQALAVLGSAEDPFARIHAFLVRQKAAHALGRGDEVLQEFDTLLEQARQYGDGSFLAASCCGLVRHHARRGDFAAARRWAEVGLGYSPGELLSCAFRCFLEYSAGEFAAGDRFRAQILAQQRSAPSGPYLVHIHAVSTALVRAYTSGESGELKRYGPLLRSIAGHPQAVPFVRLRAHLLLAFLATQARDSGLAREAYEALERRPRLDLVRPYLISRLMGLAAGCQGDQHRAAEHLRQALREVRHLGDRPLEGWILCELGETLGESRGLAESDPGGGEAPQGLLGEALAIAEGLGLLPLGVRCRANLARLAAREGFGGRGFRLSRRELDVLRLLARGLTNARVAMALGVSPFTVANHLRRILEKTGARSRVEAVALARRSGVLEA